MPSNLLLFQNKLIESCEFIYYYHIIFMYDKEILFYFSHKSKQGLAFLQGKWELLTLRHITSCSALNGLNSDISKKLNKFEKCFL